MLLLLAAVAAAQDGLEERITSGKARKLADEGLALVQRADAIWKRWVLEQIPDEQLESELKQAADLYDEGTGKLNDAVDIRNDPGINHQLRLAAQKLAKIRANLLWIAQRRAREEQPATRPAPEEPAPEDPAPDPQPQPAPVRESPPPTPPSDEEEPAPRVAFAQQEPPARPVNADLPALDWPGTEEERARQAKQDERAIEALLKAWYGSRKPGKLQLRHKLCRGKGAYRDGSRCEECAGTGLQINLYHFRKVYWNVYSPLLRDAEGALAALKGFHARALADPFVLGPEVKTFRVETVEHHGLWAKARVAVKTTEGEARETITLVSIGSNWFFFHPEADATLLPSEE